MASLKRHGEGSERCHPYNTALTRFFSGHGRTRTRVFCQELQGACCNSVRREGSVPSHGVRLDIY